MKKTILTIACSIFLAFNVLSINVVSNGNFELGTTTATSWWMGTGTTGNYTFEITPSDRISGANSALITVNKEGTVSTSGIFQFISVPKASVYTVTFTAKASTDCSLSGAVLQAFPPYTWLASTSKALSTTSQTFSYTLGSATNPAKVGLHKLAFFCGTVPVGTKIWIDDITVVENAPLSDLNLVNGDFEQDVPNVQYKSSTYTTSLIYGWTSTKLTAATNPAMTVTLDKTNPISGALSLKVVSSGTLSNSPLSSDQTLLTVFAGQKDMLYTLSFKAKASAPCSVGVGLTAWAYVSSSSSNYIGEKTVKLTTDVQSFSYTSTVPFLNPDGRLLLKFLFGKLPQGFTVWLDDVQMSVASNLSGIQK